MDVYYRDAFICPTEKEYLQVVDASKCTFMC
jgi:hypothetical protein